MSHHPHQHATAHTPPVGERPARRAVFLDRDGVIIEDSPAFIRRPDQVRLLDSAAESIRRLNDAGYMVVVVTNQSGVARGYMTEADVGQINRHISDLLAEHGSEDRSRLLLPGASRRRDPSVHGRLLSPQAGTWNAAASNARSRA